MTEQASACACCGREPEGSAFATLHCRPDVAVCDVCSDWLVHQNGQRRNAAAGRATLFRVQPMFAVEDMKAALAHYAAKGFDMESHDDGYAFAERDHIVFHLVRGRETVISAPSAVYIHVDDVDVLATEWGAPTPENMDYGLRESKLVDLDGNIIRFGSPPPD